MIKHIKVLSYCLYILIIIYFALPVYAMDSELKVNYNDLIIENNGAKIKLETIINQDNNIVLTTDTTGLKKDYYTSQISLKKKIDLSSYSELSFYMKNLTNENVKMNFFVILKDGSFLTVDKFLFINKKNDEFINLLNINDGMFEFKGNFDGMVNISLSSLNVNREQLKDIISLGIQITTEDNAIQKIEFGDLILEPLNSLSVTKEFLNLKVNGDKNITKPIVGESIVKYNLSFDSEQEQKKNEVSFFLKEKTDGVSITKDGILTVRENIDCEKVNIEVVINSRFILLFEVNMIDSHILNMKDSEGLSLTVPKVDEVQSITNSQHILNRNDFLTLFRVIIILISILIIIFYIIWRINRKKDNISNND